MENMRSLIKRETELVEYGVVRVKLAEMLDKRGITRNHLRTLTDLKYGIIDRYYKAQTIAYVDQRNDRSLIKVVLFWYFAVNV